MVNYFAKIGAFRSPGVSFMFRHFCAAALLFGFASVAVAEEATAPAAPVDAAAPAPAVAPAPAATPAQAVVTSPGVPEIDPELMKKKLKGKDPNEMICSTDRQIGSNIPKRVCMTRADRIATAEASKRQLELRHADVTNPYRQN
ncbi:MAG: hypothetical protein ACREVL_13945 [Solimonas sp.]